MSTENPVVIDLGSESIKAGYAHAVPSEGEPRIVTPSLVAVAGGRRRRVIERGAVADWDGLDATLHHLLYEQLGWAPGSEGAALFVEPLLVGKAQREGLAQLMFEGFNVMGFFTHDCAALSLFATGALTGLAADVGHGTVDVAAVVEGTTHAPSAARLGFAGEELTAHLGALLAGDAQGLAPAQLGALKVACAAVAPSAAAFAAACGGGGGAAAAPQEYTLPDGTVFSAPPAAGLGVGEALLEPARLGRAGPGLVDAMLEVLGEQSDASAKRAVAERVLLAGGGACADGLGRRVLSELRGQLPPGVSPGLAALPEYMALPGPAYVPWVGGAVMAKLVAHQGHFMVKAEYEEIGPSAVHRKCA
ncbi:ARP7 [Scenedesmus sp. PABB004]|nr:ARP7 [Scenedesmus sp. PABB004]